MGKLSLSLMFLFWLAFKVSFGQNDTNSRRWLFQLIPQNSELKNYVEARNIFPSLANRPSDYLIKNSPIPLKNFGKNYYYLIDFFKHNFYRAHEFCNERGMELVRIENKAESDFIEKQLRDAKIKEIWLGASDLAEEGKFVWFSTGEKVKYSSFDKGQPDNAGGKEHCVEFARWEDRLVWNDAECNLTKNFICQVSTCNDFCV